MSISFTQNLLNECRHFPLPKPALAVTAIQPRFKFLTLRGIVRLVKNRFPFYTARHGKGIVELKRNELRDIRRVKMRQKSALMPAAKAFLQFGDGWFPIPLTFGPDEFKQAKILWRLVANWFQ